MRDYPIVFVVVILITVGTLGSYYVGSGANDGASPSSSACSQPVGPRTFVELPNGTRITGVYQMAPGSSATMCVTYTFDRSGAFAPSTNPLLCGPYRAANRSVIWSCPGRITVTPSIQPFSRPSHQNLTVNYALQAPLNYTGVYWFWLDCDDVIPIVVGPLPSALVFPIIPGCIYEVNLHYTASVVGVSNMAVAMVLVG